MLRFTPPTLAILLCGALVGIGGACAGSEEGDEIVVPKKIPDAAAYDTSVSETAVGDSAAPDTAKDTGAPCPPLTTESKACGRCGTRTRTCSSFGIWNEWSLCKDEKSVTEAECTIDEVRATPCGNCGTQKDSCDPTTCTWNVGVCLGEGPCAPGDEETSTASCPVVGEVRTRTCSDKCAWSAFGDCTLPKGWIDMATTLPTGFDARASAAAVWTGTDMIVWGGIGSYVSSNYSRRNGAAYNPSSNAWKPITLPPSTFSARHFLPGVWTGSKMLVWGGYDYSTSYKADGAAYDPVADTWTLLAASPLVARQNHGAVWSTTTNEMIVWGGYGSSCTGSYCADGAAYDPATNSWSTIPAAPIAGRQRFAMVWTGTEVVIWGGQGTAGYLRDGARFDPKTKIWTKFPDPPAEFEGRMEMSVAWSGKEMLVWGGYGNYVSPTYGKSDGARYLPGGSWTRFTPSTDGFGSGAVTTRFGTHAWFGGGKLWLWGGANGNSSSGSALSGGASYDPAIDKWTAMDAAATGAPTGRTRAAVVWTGKEAIIWGGASTATNSYPTVYSDGKIYRP